MKRRETVFTRAHGLVWKVSFKQENARVSWFTKVHKA
jgi:hypothetical protein